MQLSLSRLNHGQPRIQAHPDIVQGTAQFHHESTAARLPQTAPVFDNAAALDTTVDILDPQPPLVEYLVGPVLLQGQLRTAWLLRRHQDFALRERAGQEAQSLQQPTPGWQWVGGGLRDAQIMDTAAVGVAQKKDDEPGIDEQDVLERVVFFLPAIAVRLCRRGLGADDAPFGAVMGKRGDGGAAVRGTGASSRGTTTVAASASETPRRGAKAVRERAGALPRVRNAVSNVGRRMWIHCLALPLDHAE